MILNIPILFSAASESELHTKLRLYAHVDLVHFLSYRLTVHFVTLVKIPTFSYSDRAIVLYTVVWGLLGR